jgi:hypothetical protein
LEHGLSQPIPVGLVITASAERARAQRLWPQLGKPVEAAPDLCVADAESCAKLAQRRRLPVRLDVSPAADQVGEIVLTTVASAPHQLTNRLSVALAFKRDLQRLVDAGRPLELFGLDQLPWRGATPYCDAVMLLGERLKDVGGKLQRICNVLKTNRDVLAAEFPGVRS